MSALNIKYFFTAKLDGFSHFIRCNLPRLIFFACFFILGAVMGILSSLKPVDPLQTFSDVNAGIFGVIAHASYAGYIFSLTLFTSFSVVVFCFVGRYMYSTILTSACTVCIGFYQGMTIVLVVRSFGILAVPFSIAYALCSLLSDFLFFALFAILAEVASDKRKYGCSTPFVKVLRRAVVIGILCIILVLLKSLLLILFSFFL